MRKRKIFHPTQKSRLPLFLGLIVAGLLFLQVVASNRLANLGTHISQVESDVNRLTLENQLLAEQIASESALLAVSAKAEKLGFTKPVAPIFLSDLPVALNSRK